MIELLQQEIHRHGDRAVLIPIQRLQNIRADVAEMKKRADLNRFQQFILNDLYRLDVPEIGFEPRSILLVASPSPSAAELLFTWQGRRVPVKLPASYVDKAKAPRRIEDYLGKFLGLRGYHLRHAPQLPHKLLAVRSGLGEYGRNNICYVAGMGSFLNLNPFFSDLPCPEGPWHEIRAMEACRTCQACLRHCPTAAILPERFLIDNERCLTYFNEAGGEWDFPDWIDPAVHHTLYGCMRCQAICPVNQPYMDSRMEPVAFSAAETDLLLQGQPFELLPEDLQQKVTELDMLDYLSAIPRNLRVLLEQAGEMG